VPFTVATLSGHSIHDIPSDPPKGAFCDIRNLEKVADGEEAILTVMLTLFDDGCALGVTINHGCSDGGSFGAFMQDWSDCHASKHIEPVLMGLPMEALRVPYEEEVDHFTKTEISSVKDLLDEYNDPNSTTRADKAAHGAAPAGRQCLHFSDKTLQQLKSKAEEGADTWVSTNEALLAHVYTLLLDAAGVHDRKKCGIVIAVDLRGKVGGAIPQRMLGRAVVNTNALAGEELLVDLSDPTKAGERVHNAVRRELDSSKLLCRHEAGNYFFAHNMSLSGPSPESTHRLSWNFQGKTPFYAIDFGAGAPVRGVPWNCGEEVKVVPCAQGGFDVFISDTARLRSWAMHDFVGQVVAAHRLE
jgi:shikimate O-hydroxycinnamoyltransferase